MKIAIITLNGMPCNGETYFAIDLAKGINRNGHQADLISLNYLGKKSQSDVVENNILYVKYRDIETLNKYDFLFFNCGKFKGNYSQIRFDKLIPRKGLCVHNCSSIKTYNLEELNKLVKFDLLFSNDEAVSEFFGRKACVLKLPFDTQKPKAVHDEPYRLIVPTRFTFAKYIQDVVTLLQELHLDYPVYFYGKEGFYFNTIKECFDGFNCEFMPAFKSDQEKAESVYKNALIAFDGSNFKTKGHRVQIVQLECFHHGVVPCMKRSWFYEGFKENVNGVAFEDVEAIKKVINDKQFRENIIENNKALLSNYFCENVASDLIKILKENK